MANSDFSKAESRIAAGTAAGEEYEQTLETIRDNLLQDTGQSLGQMVGAQLEMTEAETKYQVSKGLPTAASKAVKSASDEIKKTAG